MDDLKKYKIKFEYIVCIVCKTAKNKMEFGDWKTRICHSCVERIFKSYEIRELKGDHILGL